MPVQLGARADAGFDDPLALLSDCHRRIERFLGVLIRVADRTGGGALSEEHRRALETALRYFKEAAPKHTQDEESSLFPRMRGVDDEAVRHAMAQVDRLEAQHVLAEGMHAQIDDLGRRWLERGTLEASETALFQDLLLRLHRLYQEHIAVEDKAVFPLAGRVLAPEELEAVGREMAARRGIGVVNVVAGGGGGDGRGGPPRL